MKKATDKQGKKRVLWSVFGKKEFDLMRYNKILEEERAKAQQQREKEEKNK